MSYPDADTGQTLGSIGAVFDHVAHAVPLIRPLLPLYRDLLGGTPVMGGVNPWGGHLAVQFAFRHGAMIELLEPVQPASPSVGAFLARSPRGGLHHLTFKVADLREAIDKVISAGFAPFGTMLDHPGWKETFLHPRETGGVLIQLAQGTPHPLDRPLEHLLDEADKLRREQGMGDEDHQEARSTPT